MLAIEASLDVQVKVAPSIISPLVSLAVAENRWVSPARTEWTVGVTTTTAIVDPLDEGALTSVWLFPPPHAVKANAVTLNAREATYFVNGYSGPELLSEYPS